MSSKRLRVLSYDISGNKCRRRVAAILEDAGTRVQYSVFETRISDTALSDLVARIRAEIDPADSIRVYTIGATGEKHSESYGASIPVDRDVGYWLM